MDLEEFGIDDDFNYLKKLSKYKMKKIIREAFKNNAFDDLLEKQMTYSKGNELVYGELKMRSYLKNQNINTKNKKLIFTLRSRMYDVKQNYKGTNLFDMTCPCCFTEQDTQLHLIFCTKLTGNVTKEEYNYIFGNNDEKIGDVIKKIERKTYERKNILNK